jgi:hypothetical protein
MVLPSGVPSKARTIRVAPRLLETSDRERLLAGRALHRDVAPGLSAALLQLELLQREEPAELAQAAPAALERTVAALRNSANALRAIELSLRPPLLEEAGLGPPLRWLADQEGLTAELPRIPRLAPALEWQLFQAAATLLRQGLRGRRRLSASVPPLVLRLQGRPTAALPAALAEARARLAGRARIIGRTSLEIRVRASE